MEQVSLRFDLDLLFAVTGIEFISSPSLDLVKLISVPFNIIFRSLESFMGFIYNWLLGSIYLLMKHVFLCHPKKEAHYNCIEKKAEDLSSVLEWALIIINIIVGCSTLVPLRIVLLVLLYHATTRWHLTEFGHRFDIVKLALTVPIRTGPLKLAALRAKVEVAITV